MTGQSCYDKTSIASIFEYSQKLIGHSLRELVSKEEQESNALASTSTPYICQEIQPLYTNNIPTNQLNR